MAMSPISDGQPAYPKPWLLPLLVILIVLPVGALWVLGGPFFGLLAGGVIAAVVVIVAVRSGEGRAKRFERWMYRRD